MWWASVGDEREQAGAQSTVAVRLKLCGRQAGRRGEVRVEAGAAEDNQSMMLASC